MTGGSSFVVPDDSYTDTEDRPLGGWMQVGLDEWRAILGDAGGLEALTVFASLTDPNGRYGSAQIYTAWGRREDRAPLLDVRDYYQAGGRDGGVTESILRKFVLWDENGKIERPA